MTTWTRRTKIAAGVAVAAIGLSGCGFSPYDIPLPGGADTGDNPYTVTAEFRDVLDLVPQSGVRVNDLAVGKVTDITLNGWTAVVTLEVNGDAKLPDNAVATIRQTSLLGEKFVSLATPASGAVGELSDGDKIPLERSGRNPEIEEVFSAASLLLNGGGLERTNTIVRELNQTLGGNEPEIKELLESTTEFLGQLDDNKESLLTSLEQINGLAIATDRQRDSITGALDNLPEALRVVNDQRDDLVTLLQSLDRLGDVATGVIRQSKADTVADLKLLVPTLTNLSASVDDFAYDFKALLSYPFVDSAAGGVPAKAFGRCSNTDRDKNTGYCTGDFANLSVRLEVGADNLEGVLSLLGLDLAGLADGGVPAGPSDLPEIPEIPEIPGVAELQEALKGLNLPGLGALTSPSAPSTNSTNAPATPAPDAGSNSGTGSGGGGLLCGLFGSCRVAPAPDLGSADLASVLLQPAVTP